MYETCPKCSYQRQPTDTGDPGICPGCGIIFAKWMKQQFTPPAPAVEYSREDEKQGLVAYLIEKVLYVEPKTDPAFFYGRLILFIGIVYWGWQFIWMDFTLNPPEIGNSFMHRINLVFHEAGHVLFIPFGWFMTILGGTLGQLLMPFVVMLVFLFKSQNTFGASVGLWWLGQSFMDVAPYINDALKQQLVLLGGRTGADAPGNHDWNNLLGELNRLEKCHEYATIVHNTGVIIMLVAFVWGGYILYQQYINMKQ